MDAVGIAFEDTPRAAFLPAAQRRRAGHDGPLDLGHGQTCSQPATVARMLRLLDVRRAQRVLDVGSGSGWTTALLAHLTGPDGVVLGVERIPALAVSGATHLAAMNRPWACILPARAGVLGLPDQGPFDRVLVSANARRLPQGLVDQVARCGRLVLPVNGVMLLVEVDERGRPAVSEHGHYRFVPLL